MPSARNVRWSLDFVSDALVAGTSLSGSRVGRDLDTLVMLRGRTTTIVSDNGTELTSHAMLRWQLETGIAWHYIQPGKPQ